MAPPAPPPSSLAATRGHDRESLAGGGRVLRLLTRGRRYGEMPLGVDEEHDGVAVASCAARLVGFAVELARRAYGGA